MHTPAGECHHEEAFCGCHHEEAFCECHEEAFCECHEAFYAEEEECEEGIWHYIVCVAFRAVTTAYNIFER